jgi:hypothetical protein
MTAITAPRHAAVAADSRRTALVSWLPLTVILVAQTVLSARLISLSIASGDESLYI